MSAREGGEGEGVRESEGEQVNERDQRLFTPTTSILNSIFASRRETPVAVGRKLQSMSRLGGDEREFPEGDRGTANDKTLPFVRPSVPISCN